MTNTHTPGPWAVRAGDRGQKTVIVPHVDGYSVIAERVDSAAAPIIAAAPELISALKAVLQDWRADLMMRGCSMSEADEMMGCREGYDLARAAIAKAEGRE